MLLSVTCCFTQHPLCLSISRATVWSSKEERLSMTTSRSTLTFMSRTGPSSKYIAILNNMSCYWLSGLLLSKKILCSWTLACLPLTSSHFLSCVLRQIGENLVVPSGVKTVDAYGQLVIPGGIDANTNLHAPQKGLNPIDDFYQGTRAAVFGGTTMISQFITNNLSMLLSRLRSWDRSYNKDCCVHSRSCAGGAGD